MLDEIIRRVRNLSLEEQKEILETLTLLQQGRQREYPRLKANSDIDLVSGNRVIQTVTRDISASGVYINAMGKFETDKTVRLVFTVPDHDKPFKLEGKIVRVEQNGLAIQFDKTTPYFKAILDKAIWK